MAKSIRSKFKRKMRAIKRKRIEPRELKRLEATVARLPAETIAEAVMETEERQKEAIESATVARLPAETIAEAVMETEERQKEAIESMETDTKGSINLKTMKKADGTFPSWLSQRKVKQVKKKQKMILKAKKKKAKRNR
ncbi:Protein LLP -like protein [Toxocara canis]|uniref:Protein LLP-like protein n=1 Tax=Toxocara canis TaxID=6265 RepID=A0A0B2W3G0_TOXCA|nr:Protein LLP -like protein [Toxocara canis]